MERSAAVARDVRAEARALVSDLLERLAATGARELEVRRDGIRVKVARTMPAAASAPAVPPTQPGPAAPVSATTVPSKTVNAPLTGIFYTSASPQSPDFVQVGSMVGVGDVIGLIEAMKLFNEIKSTAAGKVKRILVDNGQLVRAHAPLVELE